MKKIVQLATIDFANIGHHISECVNTTQNEYKIVPYCIERHPYLYKTNNICISDNPTQFLEDINTCDVIQVKDDTPLSAYIDIIDRYFGIKLHYAALIDRPIISIVEGGWFRRVKMSPPLIVTCAHEAAHERYPYELYHSDSNIIVALTPDLNYPQNQGVFIQQPYIKKEYSWMPSNRNILHSPSAPLTKGTAIINQAMESVIKERPEYKYVLLQGMDNNIVLDNKKNAAFFIDQCIVGCYGVSLLEAASYGAICLCYLSNNFFVGSQGKIDSSIPVINFLPEADELQHVIERVISLSDQDRLELSLKTKKWVDDFHGYETVAKEWIALYKKLGV